MKLIKILFVLIVISFSVFSQEKVTISGYIKDASSGEELIGASVYIPELKLGSITNVYGFYSLTIPAGEQVIQFSYIGYKVEAKKLNLTENLRLDIELGVNSEVLSEVIVSAEAEDHNIRSTEMGVVKLNIKAIKSLPVLFGEQDILKTIQLMPGVKSSGEGGTGFYVRGGNSDQNLILLDESTVYSASHLLGFFSVFNSDALKDVRMIKGGMPAEYGGRLASVLDIKMKEGNMKTFGASGGIGLIASRLTVEGPIVKDKGSFILSGRRTYFDLFLKISSDENIRKARLYFYDFNMKANYKIGKNDRIYLSGYFGRDAFGSSDVGGVSWGNTTTTLRWNHLFSEKLFLNSSLIYSDYIFDVGVKYGDDEFGILSGIKDINIKENFQYYISPSHTLKFGLNSIYHTFRPGEITSSLDMLNDFVIDKVFALESALYLSHEYKFRENISLNYGIRYSNFNQLGPGDIYSYNDDDDVIETISYSKNQNIQWYGGFEPRLAINYTLNPESSFKLSYARNRQYIHLLSNSTSDTPMDAWMPSSKIILPEIADQIAFGYFRNFADNKFETSVELYYKDMQNQVDYENDADLMLNPLVESQLVFGIGRAYGVELYIKKKVGRFTGWLSYTLSRTEKKFDEINSGDWFSAKYDRTHDVSIVGMYKLNDKWSLSGAWVYYTGNAVTFPSGKYEMEGQIIPYFTERGGYRMPNYHRLDLGATLINKKTDKFESSWNFSVYNAYARQNAYTITFEESETDPNKLEAVQVSLFSLIPSITYNFKF